MRSNNQKIKKKILFVINTLGKAGAETALIELMNKTLAAGHEVYLYVMIPMGEIADLIPKEAVVLNDSLSNHSVLSRQGKKLISRYVFKLGMHSLLWIRMLPYMILNAFKQKKNLGRIQSDKILWRLIAEASPRFDQEFDLAVAFIEGASTYYVAEHVKAKHKAAFVHIDYSAAGYLPFMDKDCYSEMDKIFTVSKEVKQKFIDFYPQYTEKMDLFYNIINVEKIRKKALEKGFQDDFDGVRIVSVGRLHYQKGYDLAIDSCAKLVSEGYPIRWYVLGDGPEKDNLISQIRKNEIEENFILLGAKDNPYPYINGADLYVQVSRFEGKSIAIEEAMALGKAIVASDCTGNLEQVTDGVIGKIVSLNVDSIVSAIRELIQDKTLRMKYEQANSEAMWDNDQDYWKIEELLKD